MHAFTVLGSILILLVLGAATAATVERHRERWPILAWRRPYRPTHGLYVGTVDMPLNNLRDADTETIRIQRSAMVRPFVPPAPPVDPAPVVVDPVHVGATEAWSPLAWVSDEVIGYRVPDDTPEQRQRDRDHVEALEDDDFVRGFRAIESHLRVGLAASEPLWATDETILRWIKQGLADPEPPASVQLHPVRVWISDETSTGEFSRRDLDALLARS